MTEEPPRAARLVALLCLAEALGMTGFAAYPAFLPALRSAWGMSGAEAGFVGGAFFFGYMLAVPLLGHHRPHRRAAPAALHRLLHPGSSPSSSSPTRPAARRRDGAV